MEIPLRHELKYHISPGSAEYLSRLCAHVMRPDPNGGPSGRYHIRSLYFDDIFESSYTEKIDGVLNRDKYRIRIYNLSDSVIRLERKRKVGDFISKQSATLSRALCDQILAGDTYGLERLGNPLLGDLFRMMTVRRLRPAVIVDYWRQAFLLPAEETRVTFDSQLRSGLFSNNLFDPAVPTVSPLRQETVILEVKFDRRCPELLPPLLSSVPATRSAISKYTLCRGFAFSD